MMGEEKINIQIPIRDQLAGILRSRIIEGVYTSGQKLVERDLSKEFDVSPTPVKEALRMLEAEQLVHTIPRKGTVVTAYEHDAFVDFVKARSALEGVIASIAVANLTAEELSEMDSLLEDASKYLDSGNVEEAANINGKFHAIIRSACRNNYLIQIVQSVRLHENLQRSKAMESLEERRTGYLEHCEIQKAFRERDAERVEALMREHVRRSGMFVYNSIRRSGK
ncbi:MAG: GntR family transcriptional regulator [Spirochaetales bacterium]|nr:GntR family transcriptional regulator [Spirochaetales bacterium]